MNKEYKVVMLPTEHVTGLYYSEPRDEYWYTEGISEEEYYSIDWKDSHKAQHLYFVSDEEIKEGDWIVHESHGAKGLHKAKSVVSKGDIKSIITTTKEGCWLEYCKKVIATTDKLLLKGLKDGYPRNYYVPTIPESYIKKYVEGNGKETIVRLEMEMVCIQTGSPCGATCFSENFCRKNAKLKLTGNEVIVVNTEPKTYTKEDMIEFGKIARRSNGNIAMKEVFKEWEE